MSIKLDDNQARELLPLYALGALEPEDMLRMESYLEQHAELRRSLAEVEEALRFLSYAAPEAPLPPEARRQLIERVRADVAGDTPAPAPPLARPVAAAVQADRPARRLPRLIGLPARWLAAAACLLLLSLAGLGLYVGRLQARVDALVAEVAQLRAETSDLRQTTDALRDQVRGDQQQLALLASSQRTLPLVGLAAPEARGTFYVDDAQGEGVLVVSGLDPLGEQQTYQLWLVQNGTPISVGLLEVRPGEPTVTTVSVPAAAQGFVAFDVSVEPTGGSPTLLGPVVLQWKATETST
jgi:anti-sigma-K factor RskA